MSYRIARVEYRNFGPFEDDVVDFSLPGLTGIEGLVSWKKGTDSNGAGKSMLFAGVSWCVWGRCIQEDYKGDDVIRIGSKGGASVVTHIEGGPLPLRIERYRKHPTKKNHTFLFVDGVDKTRGVDAETQRVIEDTLGCDFKAWCSSAAFGASEAVKSFFAATDTDRKSILERILGLGLYADAEKVAKLKVRDLVEELSPLTSRCESLNARWVAKRDMIDSISVDEDVDDLAFQVTLAKAKTLRLASQLGKAECASDFSDTELAELVDADALLRREYNQIERERESARRAHEREAVGFDQKAAVAQSNAQRVGKKIEDLKLETSWECPTCHQEVEVETSEDVLAALATEQAEFEASSVSWGEKARVSREDFEEEAALPPFLPCPKIATAHDVCNLDTERCSAIAQNLETAKHECAQAEAIHTRATSQLQSLRREMEGLDADLEEAKAAEAVLQKRLTVYSFWAEGFGNRGLKSFLIEAEVATISNAATGYARRLLGPGAKVELRATTQLKNKAATTREKLSINAEIPGFCKSYAGASQGNKRRLDLSLLLAFRDVLANRSQGAFQQFFADELFDGLDRSGTEAVVEMLRGISKECPVTLVTHNPHMRSAMDRAIVVTHEKEYLATVSQAGVTSKPKKTKRRKLKV